MDDRDALPSGRVCFVGAGPGAPDLLTIRAAEALRAADVVVHDALVPSRVLEAVGAGARLIPVERARHDADDPGSATGDLLARLAVAGARVVRLKGGDPAIFGRLAEEMEPVRRAGVPVEIVPGVTAALAAAAAAGASLTSRLDASAVSLLTGREAEGKDSAVDYRPLATLPGTLAVYMGVEQAARWSRDLIAAGRPASTPVTVVSRCGWADEQIGATTLGECGADAVRFGWRSPAVVIVGVSPTASGPLAGRVVLVTRPAGQEGELVAAIRAAGGRPLHVPVVEITDPPSWQPLDESLGAASTYDWIVFASANGVRAFLGRMEALRLDGRELGTARLAAIGPATRRELEHAGFRCDLTPTVSRSEDLAVDLAATVRRGRFLLVRAAQGRAELRAGLESRGHHVDEVVAYRTQPRECLDPDEEEAVVRVPVDWIVLTSPSIASAAARLFGDRLRGWRIATISPVTSAALGPLGLRADVEAGWATADGLVEAIIRSERGAADSSRSEAPADAAQVPPSPRG